MYNIRLHYICRNKYIFNTKGQEESILHMVQMSRIFPDSKTFVDMKLRYRPAEIELAYQQLMTKENDQPSKSAIIQFVNDNFMMTFLHHEF